MIREFRAGDVTMRAQKQCVPGWRETNVAARVNFSPDGAHGNVGRMKKPAPIESLGKAQARREHARLGEEIAAHDRRSAPRGRANYFATSFFT